ncbi:SMP-30/gluconolactonase/LRE family protein [Sphingomonas suaedae]|uniref:SMP-30/gluconolactonase/LRE family protein n=1 Tax=Sphingomonas suaedae TaxID=2599297 RepID=A0A518RC93_9SPHN|nr:SMP-30/gluconolactonase/LRE family protein [Sphingomonas suaedae]QDX25034.1 SMP-30/gluconolactonase/LRE family protein [Sphingomonas suaedae]
MRLDDVQIISRNRCDQLGEGPLAARDGSLYWVDIIEQRINRLSLADRTVNSWIMPEMVGWVIERRDASGLVAGFRSGVKVVVLDPASPTPVSIEPLVDLPADEPAINRMNDAKADRDGRLWAGTMPVSCDVPAGSLYRIEADRSIERMDNGYHVANGPAISPDGRWLFHTNTVLGQIYRFALDGATLGPRELWLQFESDWGHPDGMTFDAEGGLWVAHWGGSRVSRFDPDGKVERAIHVPASQITSMTFAGDSYDRMFITSAADGIDEPHGGYLFEVDPGVKGLPPHRFAG